MTESSRRELASLGIPRERQTVEALTALLPSSLGEHVSLAPDTLVEALVHFVKRGLISVPAATAEQAGRGVVAGSHSCLFYRGMSELLELSLAYLREGLDRGELCVWVLPEGFTSDAALRALGAVDGLAYRRLRFMTRAEAYMGPDGRPLSPAVLLERWHALAAEAADEGLPGVRGTGDSYWVGPENIPWLLDYEAALTEGLAGRGVTSLCTHSLERLPRTAIAPLARAHGAALFRKAPWWHSESAPGRADAVLSFLDA